MSKVKYLGQYTGAGYSSFDQEYLDGFTSLYQAMCDFRRRNVMGYDGVDTYRENLDGTYVIWETDARVLFPSTTDEDYMDLYHVVQTEGGYILGDVAYRVSLGPRKGVRVKRA